MTRDEMIKMASMAGFETKNGMVWVDQCEVTRTMERFFHAAYAAGAAAEQGACKDACTRYVNSTNDAVALTALNILDAIRARSAK